MAFALQTCSASACRGQGHAANLHAENPPSQPLTSTFHSVPQCPRDQWVTPRKGGSVSGRGWQSPLHPQGNPQECDSDPVSLKSGDNLLRGHRRPFPMNHGRPELHLGPPRYPQKGQAGAPELEQLCYSPVRSVSGLPRCLINAGDDQLYRGAENSSETPEKMCSPLTFF